MNFEEDFLKKYHRVVTLKPIAGSLAIAKDNSFYWLYYSGMGETDYHKLPDMEQKIVNSLLQKQILIITDSTRVLPVYWEDGVIAEIKFQIVCYFDKNFVR